GWLLGTATRAGLRGRGGRPRPRGVVGWGAARGGLPPFPPGAPPAPAATILAAHDTAVVLDTDSVFHGVDRVAESATPLPPLAIGMRLTFEGDDTWRGGFGDDTLIRYPWDDIRFSVSWKAYCVADEDERRMGA